MRRSKSIRLTLLPWLASAALGQAQTACGAARTTGDPRMASEASFLPDPDDCFADAADDAEGCDGPARRITTSVPTASELDAVRAPPTADDAMTDTDDTADAYGATGVLSAPSAPGVPSFGILRGGFGHYFWSGGG